MSTGIQGRDQGSVGRPDEAHAREEGHDRHDRGEDGDAGEATYRGPRIRQLHAARDRRHGPVDTGRDGHDEGCPGDRIHAREDPLARHKIGGIGEAHGEAEAYPHGWILAALPEGHEAARQREGKRGKLDLRGPLLPEDKTQQDHEGRIGIEEHARDARVQVTQGEEVEARLRREARDAEEEDWPGGPGQGALPDEDDDPEEGGGEGEAPGEGPGQREALRVDELREEAERGEARGGDKGEEDAAAAASRPRRARHCRNGCRRPPRRGRSPSP